MKQLSEITHGDIQEALAGKLWAFTPVMYGSRWGLGVAIANEAGFSPVSTWHFNAENYAAADDECDRLNALRGLSVSAALDVVASSMAQGEVQK